MMKMQRFDPDTTPAEGIYKLLVGAVIPRPIAFVSSIDEHGVYNLAPFSFFTVCSANPPIVCFTAGSRVEPRPYKDTLFNVMATKEFVVNFVSEEFAVKMNATSQDVLPEVDEFELAGLTPVASELVKPPRVAESHVHMECRLRQVLHLSDKLNGGNLVLGDVVRIHMDETIVEDYKVDPDKMNVIGRMGGATYVRIHDRFDIPRPK
jgi:flavin reductase (DIM6/NTAB) family NADH-FMN oxidoreductase RutF